MFKAVTINSLGQTAALVKVENLIYIVGTNSPGACIIKLITAVI
jgi:hypothetical protein